MDFPWKHTTDLKNTCLDYKMSLYVRSSDSLDISPQDGEAMEGDEVVYNMYDWDFFTICIKTITCVIDEDKLTVEGLLHASGYQIKESNSSKTCGVILEITLKWLVLKVQS